MADAVRADVMLMTPDEFLVYPLSSVSAELVRGELRVTPPPGGPHGCTATNLVVLLAAYVKGREHGRVFADGVGYELIQLPHTVRSPDASFVRFNRLPQEGIGPGFLKLAPDLAVEVLSPSESASDRGEARRLSRVRHAVDLGRRSGAADSDDRRQRFAGAMAARDRHTRRWRGHSRIPVRRGRDCRGDCQVA